MPVDQTKNKRMMLNVPQPLALRIECLAEMDRRSMSNWILNLVQDHIDSLSDEDAEELDDLFFAKLDRLPPAKAEVVIQQEKAANKGFWEKVKADHPQAYESFKAASKA